MSRLAPEAGRSGSGLLNQGRVLLGSLVHLCDGLPHLTDAAALFLTGGADFADDVVDALDGRHDLFHRLTRMAHEFGALFHLIDAGADQRFDFASGLGAALRQRPHLTGHHRKATPLLTRA
ncbi:hypothetical protein D9M69_506500 [compost metagenome]